MLPNPVNHKNQYYHSFRDRDEMTILVSGFLLPELSCSGLRTIRDGLMGAIFLQNAIFNHFVDGL
jgi:hypothetical protein